MFCISDWCFRLKHFILFLSCVVFANAQMATKGFETVCWTPEGMAILKRGFHETAGLLLDKKGKEIKKVPRLRVEPDKGIARMHFVDGDFYATRTVKLTDKDGRKSHEQELLRYGPEGWQRECWYRATPAPSLFPLKNGRVLAIDTTGRLFTSGSKPVPFAILKPKESGELRIHSAFDADLDKPFFQGPNKLNYPALDRDFLSFNAVRTDDFLILASHYCLFWIFDLETGRLKRVAKLYPDMQDKHLRENKLIIGLLGIQPRSDGQILLSARLQDAVLCGAINRPSAMGINMDQSRSEMEAWSDFTNRRFPHIDWWELDPKTGKFTAQAPPMNVTTQLTTEKESADFNWIFKPDGNLKVMPLREHLGDPDSAPDLMKRFK